MTGIKGAFVARSDIATNGNVLAMPTEPTIFVVDDDAAVRESLQDLLQAAGFAVEAYGDGRAFLDAVDASRHGCVLLDISMPGMSGFEVLDALRANRHDLPAIIVTALSAATIETEALKAGAFAVLTKPAPERSLFEAIRRALAKTS